MSNIDVEYEENKILDIIGNVTSPFVVLSELIKNGIDANAKSVTVHINTIANTIKVIDNGDGFSLSDIKELGNIASSKKKREGNLYNNNGGTLLGSKGLAFYSVFSLGNKILIKTKNSIGESYLIEWNKNGGNFVYHQEQSDDYTLGTEIIIDEIDIDSLLLLSSDKELNKFKHISLINFQRMPNVPKVIIIKDNQRFNLEVDNINDYCDDFNAKVSFIYDSDINVLKYRYEVQDPRITDDELIINLDDEINVNDILINKYSIIPGSFTFNEYLTNGLLERSDITVPSFEGEWYVKRGRKNDKMKNFESGIKLYVNNFAMYNYLNKNNDWLQLTNISQVKKINNFRQHNVFGYLNFNDFNDLKEGMKISNERGGFIENINYHKFIDLLYTFVLYISVNIDVALKNNKFYPSAKEQKNGKEETGGNKGHQKEDDISKDTSSQDHKEHDHEETTSENDDSVSQDLKDQESKKNEKEKENVFVKESILKISELKMKMGEQLYLLDPTIIHSDYAETLKIVSQENSIIEDNVFTGENTNGKYHIDYFVGNLKETLILNIAKNKIKGSNKIEVDFFEESNHFFGDIDLSDISDLVKQLYGIDYDQKYLLYLISFRAILEDIVKKYINSRSNLKLSGPLKDNIATMVLDLQYVTKIHKDDPLKEKKLEIHKKFKGNDALNNFLVGISVKFSNYNYDKFLHSLTHNPSKIDKDLALEIANDMILPLYVLKKNLKDKGII